LPESLVRYVMRTQETVMLDDASSQNPFSADPYIVQRRARSILSLPLINRGTLIGILYLENNLTPRVFTPDRVTVLKVLASQAAISLQNTRLYRDLADREGKIRRLVDANILGIFIGNSEGAINEANDAFLRIVQYSREDLVSGRLRWTDLTPPEWYERDQRAVAEASANGTIQPYEKEYFRKDGSRAPVLVGGALFQGGGNEGVAFSLDLSEQKRAEAVIREAERELRQILDFAPWHVAVLGADGKAMYLNKAGLDYHGLTPDAFQDYDPRRSFHPDDRDRIVTCEGRAKLLSDQPFEIEARLAGKDGKYRWFLFRFNPLLDEEGRITRWFVTSTDIEDRKQ